MAIRPIDIARKLGISTTTLRTYEELGLVPRVSRSETGYRIFTNEHLAYFICIREMIVGFGLSNISKILREVMLKNIDAALWMANQHQVNLRGDKIISEKIAENLINKKQTRSDSQKAKRLMTIRDISEETGVPASTIRYWDKVGLITAKRGKGNNYRIFSEEHIQEILTIYALKFSIYSNNYYYFVDRVKEELKEFDYNDRDRIITIANDINKYLDKVNRAQISGISALYHLCLQAENGEFTDEI